MVFPQSEPLAAPDLATGIVFRDVDARIRILVTVVFAIVVVALDDPGVLGMALACAALAAVAARLPLTPTLRRAAAMDAFIIVMLLMLPFTVAGTPLLTIGPLTASREGLWQAIAIGLKANAIVLLLLALVGTMHPAVLGHALRRLGVPAVLIHLLFFTVRYVEVLSREYHRTRLAMKARAFRPRSDLHTWRSLGYLIGMLLVRSLERAERILAAMKCRGFDGRLHAGDGRALRPADGAFAAGWMLVLAVLLMLERG
jgi:cobalt/nickel transport system permease protein